MQNTVSVKSILKGTDSCRKGVSRELATKLMCKKNPTPLIKFLG